MLKIFFLQLKPWDIKAKAPEFASIGTDRRFDMKVKKKYLIANFNLRPLFREHWSKVSIPTTDSFYTWINYKRGADA